MSDAARVHGAALTRYEHRGIIAYAPGSIGNMGPGLDVLGCALTGAGDEVHAWWCDTPGVHVLESGHPNISCDPQANACAIAAQAVLDRTPPSTFRIDGVPSDVRRLAGIAMRVRKGLPLAAGQGGSAASAVAAAVAVNQLLIDAGYDGLDRTALLDAALTAESRVAGRHLDNLAASLMGGVVCVLGTDPPAAFNVPVAMELWFAIAHPDVQVRTADARAVLPDSVPRHTLVQQLGNVASLVTALATGNLALAGRAMVDHVAEPPRTHLIPGFVDARVAALHAGALATGISGSGPTTFAVCDGQATALAVAEALRWSFEASGVRCDSRVATLDFAGTTWKPHEPLV